MKPMHGVAAVLAIVLVWVGCGGDSQEAGAQAHMSDVTKAQFDRWMTDLSNWGRWGDDDERGVLNLITAEKARQAGALVQTGETVSLAHPIARRPGEASRPVDTNGALTNRFLVQGDFLFERQEIAYHGLNLSHFDALCHVSHNGKLYNGFDFAEVVTEDGGCSRLSVNTAEGGIVTRGVLLDLPETRVRPADVEAFEERTGITIGSGDALLLRTKRPGREPAPEDFGAAGYDPSLIPFFKERDIALLGADVPQEGGAIPGVLIPIHTFTIVALGMNLLDNLALHELAETAERLGRWEFMLTVEPLRVERGAGSPVNPIAVF